MWGLVVEVPFDPSIKPTAGYLHSPFCDLIVYGPPNCGTCPEWLNCTCSALADAPGRGGE